MKIPSFESKPIQRPNQRKNTIEDLRFFYEMINITPRGTVVQKTLNLSRYKRKKPASSVRTEPKKKSSRGIRAFHLSYSIFIYSSSSGFIYSSCLDFVSFIIKNELSGAERARHRGHCFNLTIISCCVRSPPSFCYELLEYNIRKKVLFFVKLIEKN